jgi:hypothetical protein
MRARASQGGISDHGAEDLAVVDAVALLEPTSNQSGTKPLYDVVGIAFTFEYPLCRQNIPTPMHHSARSQRSPRP